MKKQQLFKLFWLLVLVFNTGVNCSNKPSKEKKVFQFEAGDILFQNGQSSQCKAISAATHSDYTHCGIVFLDDNGKPYVAEAVQPVSIISLDNFISRGYKNQYVVYRLKDSEKLNDSLAGIMRKYASSQINKNYDITFQWSDSEMYCSELIWKAYHEINIDLCPTRELQDFDLTSPLVQKTLQERYGDNIPYEESVVAPSDLLKSTMLVEVYKQ